MSADFDKSERTAKIARVSRNDRETATIHFIYTSEAFLDSDDLEKSSIIETRVYDAKIFFLRIYIDGCLIYVPYKTTPLASDFYLTVSSIVDFISKKSNPGESIVMIDNISEIANFLVYEYGEEDIFEARKDMVSLINRIKSYNFKKTFFFNSNIYGEAEKEVIKDIPTIDDW